MVVMMMMMITLFSSVYLYHYDRIDYDVDDDVIDDDDDDNDDDYDDVDDINGVGEKKIHAILFAEG